MIAATPIDWGGLSNSLTLLFTAIASTLTLIYTKRNGKKGDEREQKIDGVVSTTSKIHSCVNGSALADKRTIMEQAKRIADESGIDTDKAIYELAKRQHDLLLEAQAAKWVHDAATPVDILLIEDDPSMRSLMARLAEPFNCNLQFAEDGEAGVEMVRNHRWRIVLLDLKLPLMQGIDVLDKIREINRDQSVAIVSGTMRGADYEQCSFRGVSVFILKNSIDRDGPLNPFRILGIQKRPPKPL